MEKKLCMSSLVLAVLVVLSISLEVEQLSTVCKVLSMICIIVAISALTVVVVNKCINANNIKDDEVRSLFINILHTKLAEEISESNYVFIFLLFGIAALLAIYPSIISMNKEMVIELIHKYDM